MPKTGALLKVLLFTTFFLVVLFSIHKRLREVECERCAAWNWEVCQEMRCP